MFFFNLIGFLALRGKKYCQLACWEKGVGYGGDSSCDLQMGGAEFHEMADDRLQTRPNPYKPCKALEQESGSLLWLPLWFPPFVTWLCYCLWVM